jgi:hypothetical protein
MRSVALLTIIIGFLCGCAESQPNPPEPSQKSKTSEVSRFEMLGLKNGMKRTLVEKNVSALLGMESGYRADPMGTGGGEVTYIDGLWKLTIRYWRGCPGETGVDEKGDFDDYTPAIDEEIISFEIEKLSPAISTIIAPEFGKILTIEGRFVKKTERRINDRQQFVEPCTSEARGKKLAFVEVLSVDGVELKNPVKMEYAIDYPKFHPEEGKVYELRAYETIISLGKPWGWDRRPAQYGYQAVNKLVVKPTE